MKFSCTLSMWPVVSRGSIRVRERERVQAGRVGGSSVSSAQGQLGSQIRVSELVRDRERESFVDTTTVKLRWTPKSVFLNQPWNECKFDACLSCWREEGGALWNSGSEGSWKLHSLLWCFYWIMLVMFLCQYFCILRLAVESTIA